MVIFRFNNMELKIGIEWGIWKFLVLKKHNRCPNYKGK